MAINLELLRQKSILLAKLRQFFLNRDFVEVETPLVSHEVIPELHIEPRSVLCAQSASDSMPEWLQASPELHMKRLVAAGMEALFQVTRSFRGEERGALHRPEFTIVEWYRVGDDMQGGMNLLDELLQALVQTPPAKRTSYGEAFQKFVGVNPHQSTAKEFGALDIETPAGMCTSDRDEWLNFLLATKVEPQLGKSEPEILYHYPASQAALAKIVEEPDGDQVAERFEMYWQGVELANGYHELTDAQELRSRLHTVNEARQADGRDCLPLPESLLAAMETGLPACSGCALGFDRLAMLGCGEKTLDEIIPFGDG